MAGDALGRASTRLREDIASTRGDDSEERSGVVTCMEQQEAADLFWSALELLHQVTHKAAARGLALALLLAPPALLPIVPVRILLGTVTGNN